MVGDKIASVDRKELADHTYRCPVKRKRATLGSDPLRDSWMRLRRITVRGSLDTSPPPFCVIQSYLLCLEKPRGLGAEPPVMVAYLRMGKFHFTLNQDTMYYIITGLIQTTQFLDPRQRICCLRSWPCCLIRS